MSEPEYRCIACSSIGLSGTTPVTIRQTEEGFEARMGFAIFGYAYMDEAGYEKAQYNPFHEEFHDNFVSGKGSTEESAIEALKSDLRNIGESLWL